MTMGWTRGDGSRLDLPPHEGDFQVKRLVWRGLLGIVAGLVLFAGFLLVQYASGNFHTVVAGEFYRSGQLSPDRLAGYVKRYGIRTVINLRGSNEGRAWYDGEVAMARDLGIDHVDYRMSSRQVLSQADAEHLIALMAEAKKPLLVHCEGGADRSGLASSLYVGAILKQGEDAAEWQLSPLYGHIGIPHLTKTYAMDETWENLETWLGYGKS
jgi:protein tyrosine/serine phosphatase